jgi:hypothetical protein
VRRPNRQAFERGATSRQDRFCRLAALGAMLLLTACGGDNDFWGSFETSQSGFNEFRVKLTGPAASELIGSWAVPILIDGNPHQLMGVWIAARG